MPAWAFYAQLGQCQRAESRRSHGIVCAALAPSQRQTRPCSKPVRRCTRNGSKHSLRCAYASTSCRSALVQVAPNVGDAVDDQSEKIWHRIMRPRFEGKGSETASNKRSAQQSGTDKSFTKKRKEESEQVAFCAPAASSAIRILTRGR